MLLLLLLVLFSVYRKMFALKLETNWQKVENVTLFFVLLVFLHIDFDPCSPRSMKMFRKLFIGSVSASKRRSNNLCYLKINMLSEMFARNDVWASIQYFAIYFKFAIKFKSRERERTLLVCFVFCGCNNAGIVLKAFARERKKLSQ